MRRREFISLIGGAAAAADLLFVGVGRIGGRSAVAHNW